MSKVFCFYLVYQPSPLLFFILFLKIRVKNMDCYEREKNKKAEIASAFSFSIFQEKNVDRKVKLGEKHDFKV